MSVIVKKPTSGKPKFSSATSAPSGAFETAARLDVQAAVIRNRTWTAGATLPTWGNDYAVPPDDGGQDHSGRRAPDQRYTEETPT